MGNNGGWCVYEHVFPNGKKYVGISKNAERRWMNGNGYKSQGKIWNAIEHYGWENVAHNIIVDGLSKEQAQELEKYFISELDLIENGYNTTIGGDNILSTYLNEHVLYMIRESHIYDSKYGETQPDDSIVSYAEKAKHNKKMADIFNYADELTESTYDEYKRYHGTSFFHDLGQHRVDCYWWTIAMIVSGQKDGLAGVHPYWSAWQKAYFPEGWLKTE